MQIRQPPLRAHRRSIAVAAVILAAIAMAFAFWETYSDGTTMTVARSDLAISEVRRGSLQVTVRGAGMLVSKNARWVTAEVDGLLESVDLKPGAQVEAGTVIARMTNEEIRRSVLDARTELDEARAELEATRFDLTARRLDQAARVSQVQSAARSAKLQASAERRAHDEGALPELQAQRSEIVAADLARQYELESQRLAAIEPAANARLAAQQARVNLLRNRADAFAAQQRKLDLRAAISGVIESIVPQPGQRIRAGDPVARVVRLGELMAQLRIAEAEARELRRGLPVRLHIGSASVPGTVGRVDPAVQKGTVLIDVDLIGRAPDGSRPDLAVDGIVEIAQLEDVRYVERPSFLGIDQESSIFRLNDTGDEAVRTKVRFGRLSYTQAEVITGLDTGDRIVVSDTSRWAAADRVRIR